MKKLFFIAILAVSSTVSLSSCFKEQGDLVINVENLTGQRMIGKTVYLYNTQADMASGTHASQDVTDDSGQAQFGKLSPRTYFFDCDFTLLGIDYTASGSATVEDDKETTITLKP